jgi:hypothetical protein
VQHPFEGVMQAGQETARPSATRRSALGRILGALTILFGVAGSGCDHQGSGPEGQFSTQAVGEEGGAVTTFALGEEGGRR